MAKKQQRISFWKQFCFLFFPLALITAIIASTIVATRVTQEKELIKAREFTSIHIGMDAITHEFQGIHSDLAALAESSPLTQFLLSKSPESYSALQQHFLNLCRHKKLYDQIRYLDENGMEVVRINFNQGNPVITAKEELQNKRNRYYFADIFKLNRGEVYVSPMDLNIEHGAIEQPLKPMIRFGTPVYDSLGNKKGIVLLNYFGKFVINHFRDIINPPENISTQTKSGANTIGRPMLLNSDGFWMLGLRAEDEWGFMLAHKRKFADFYPEIWEEICQNTNGHLETDEGLFIFTTISPLQPPVISSNGSPLPYSPSNKIIDEENYTWKLISYVDRPKLDSIFQKHFRFWLTLYLFFLLALFSGCFYIIRIRWQGKEAEKAKRDTERLYQHLFEQAGDSIFIADPATGKFLDCNTNAAVRLGYTRQELLTKRIYEINPEYQHNNIDIRLKRQLSGGDVTFETTHIHKDGHQIPMEISSTIIEFQGSKIMLAQGRDISERKKTQRAQQLNQIRQTQLLALYEKDRVQSAYFVSQAMDSIGKITSSPSVFFGFLNKDERIITLKAYAEKCLEECSMHDKELQIEISENALLSEAIRQRQPMMVNDYQQQYDGKAKLPEGHVAIRRIIVVPVIENNKVVALAAVANKETPYDDTDQHQMQLFIDSMWTIMQRRNAEKELLKSRQLWEQTFESVPDMVAIIDPDFKIVRVNRAVTELFDMSKEDCEGMICYHLYHNSDQPCPNCPHQKALDTRKSCGSETYHQESGTIYYTTASPLYDSEENFIGTVHVSRDITELTKHEQEIQQSKEFLQTIIDGVTDPIMVIGTDYTLKLCNKAALTSIDSADYHNRKLKCHKISHGSDTPCSTDEHPCPLKQVLETQEPMRCIHEHLIQGEKRFMEIVASPHIAFDGSILGIIESSRDITERIHTSQRLKASEESYRSMSENLPGIVYRLSLTGNQPMHFFNKMILPITGYTAAELRQGEMRDFESLILSEDKQKVIDTVKAAITSKTPFEVEYRITHKDGTRRYLMERGRPIHDTKGVTTHIDGFISDITEYKKTQASLQKSQLSLQKAQAISHLGSWEWNVKDNSLWWSEEVYRIFGLSDETFNNSYDAFLSRIHPDDVNFVKEKVNNALYNKEQYNIDHRILRNDRIRIVNEQAEVEYDLDGEAIMMRGTVQDITDRKAAEEKLKLYGETQAVLLREVNHRVKNNLSAILSMLHKEEDRVSAEEPSKLLLLHDLEARIHGLLTVHSMLSSSGWRPLPLNELCSRVINNTLRNLLPSVKQEVSISESFVEVDSNQAHNLTLILNELTTNTIKHGLPDTGINSTISVTIIPDAPKITIIYRDNGTGFPQPLLENDTNYYNVGLDLITGIVKQSLGGDLDLSNDNGAVTTITFDLEASKVDKE